MDEERLRYIVSKISRLSEFLPMVVFLESLSDRTEFIECVKKSKYWNQEDFLTSIMNFVKAYVQENGIKLDDTEIANDDPSLNEIYNQFALKSYSNLSLYELACKYSSVKDEILGRKKR